MTGWTESWPKSGMAALRRMWLTSHLPATSPGGGNAQDVFGARIVRGSPAPSRIRARSDPGRTEHWSLRSAGSRIYRDARNGDAGQDRPAEGSQPGNEDRPDAEHCSALGASPAVRDSRSVVPAGGDAAVMPDGDDLRPGPSSLPSRPGDLLYPVGRATICPIRACIITGCPHQPPRSSALGITNIVQPS
jgi:hypothetical protein